MQPATVVRQRVRYLILVITLSAATGWQIYALASSGLTNYKIVTAPTCPMLPLHGPPTTDEQPEDEHILANKSQDVMIAIELSTLRRAHLNLVGSLLGTMLVWLALVCGQADMLRQQQKWLSSSEEYTVVTDQGAKPVKAV